LESELDYASALMAVGQLFLKWRQWAAAFDVMEMCLQTRSTRLAPNSSDLIDTEAVLAQIYDQLGRYSQSRYEYFVLLLCPNHSNAWEWNVLTYAIG